MPEYYKTPTCPQAAACGGCEWLAVPYPIQLERKRAALAELFEPLGVEPQEVIGMEEPLAYRAKAMTPYQPGPKGALVHGMYKQGTHKLVPCPSCLAEDPQARPIFETIAQLCRRFRIKAYDEDRGSGLLRHAVVRCAAATGQVMVTLVVNSKEFPRKREFVKALREAHPEVSTVVFNINTRDTNAVLGSREQVAYGQGWIEDELCGQTFRIPSSAFYQTNPRQTELLYETAVQLAGLRGGESVLDAYCGIGTIGIVAAKRCYELQREGRGAGFHKKKAAKAAARAKKGGKEQPLPVKPVSLTGIETTPSAVEVAAENARINKVNGASFIQGDAGAFLRDCGEHFDVVFLDPPRAGASEDFIEGLLAANPKRIVYISCNPETQLRDIKALSGAYTLKRLVPVDMFPHTKHLETVALLVRASANTAQPAAACEQQEGQAEED